MQKVQYLMIQKVQYLTISMLCWKYALPNTHWQNFSPPLKLQEYNRHIKSMNSSRSHFSFIIYFFPRSALKWDLPPFCFSKSREVQMHFIWHDWISVKFNPLPLNHSLFKGKNLDQSKTYPFCISKKIAQKLKKCSSYLVRWVNQSLLEWNKSSLEMKATLYFCVFSFPA